MTTGLAGLLLLLLVLPHPSCKTPAAATGGGRYKVAVCDWMILKRQKPGAIGLAHEIGADGVEVDMGSLGKRPTFENSLEEPAVRLLYDSLLRHYGVEISSLAMSGFYAQSFATREGVDRMVGDCIRTMNQMGVGVAFLPLGVEGDLLTYPERRDSIVGRLRRAGAMAEKAGVVIGIETSLDAAGELALLREIGSSAVRIYFNFANALEGGRDLCRELEILGKENICQIHCTDKDGVWLENNPRLSLPAVKKTLDRMGWSGWLVLERSRDASDPRNVVRNFGANAAYVKSVFR